MQTVLFFKVIKNPISDHLPIDCKKIKMSFSASEVVHVSKTVPENDGPIVMAVGAMAHGCVSRTEDHILF